LNIAFLNTGYDTSSVTDELKIYDDGVLTKTMPNVAKGSVVRGNGHAVIGQKMNTPGTMNGWNTGEHYEG